MIPFAANELPTTDAIGCRLPFGLGFLAFVALVVLSLMVGFAALSLIFGGLTPAANQPPVVPGPGAPQELAARNAALEALPDSFIVSGSATTSVSGAFATSGQIVADPIRSYIQDGMAWLGFGDLVGGTGAAEILVTLNESGQDTVTVAQGDLAAIGQDDDCEWNISVSTSSVSGTVACGAVEVWRNATEPTGMTASIQLQFSSTLEPMEGRDGPFGPDDPAGEGDGEGDGG